MAASSLQPLPSSLQPPACSLQAPTCTAKAWQNCRTRAPLNRARIQILPHPLVSIGNANFAQIWLHWRAIVSPAADRFFRLPRSSQLCCLRPAGSRQHTVAARSKGETQSPVKFPPKAAPKFRAASLLCPSLSTGALSLSAGRLQATSAL